MPRYLQALEAQKIAEAGKRIEGDYDSYLEMWTAGFGDRFFDLSTLVRLASAIESGLRDFHGAHGGNAPDRGFYQRIAKPAGATALADKFLQDCNYKIRTNEAWLRVREIMHHRHLYAHRNGVVDESYITNLKQLTGQDITSTLQALGHPADDVYWFRPLTLLSEFIEDTRTFFRNMP